MFKLVATRRYIYLGAQNRHDTQRKWELRRRTERELVKRIYKKKKDLIR